MADAADSICVRTQQDKSLETFYLVLSYNKFRRLDKAILVKQLSLDEQNLRLDKT